MAKVRYTPTMILAWLPTIYYTICSSEVVVCPQVMRTDCGTENGAMAAIQTLLCRNTAGSHRCGTFVANQRIECFWSHLRRSRVGFIITVFKDLVDNDQLDLHDILDIGCCCYACMEYVGPARVGFKFAHVYWNINRIRDNRQQPLRAWGSSRRAVFPPCKQWYYQLWNAALGAA